MRFPSLQSLAGGAWQTFRRFPIAILLAFKATVLGIWWTHLSANYARTYIDTTVEARAWPLQWYWNAIVSCYLGMLLSVAMAKWAEKRQFSRRSVIGLQAAVLALTTLYYWSLPPDPSQYMVIRTVVLALGLHWLIAVIGFGQGEVNGFWIFNKRLFLRVLTTYLYSMVLYIGVSLALLAIDKLFNVDVRSEVYEECWWVLGGLFTVWFFLGGFPKTYENPGEISDYPRGLKIFTQYVLLTLVTVYFLILYAYMIKIILTRHWPAGWVAWMVMAFAVAGILSLLLIYPLRHMENNTWIRGYTRFFYQALLPLIILLFTAIYKRIGPYGITEQRYFLLALAWWLLFITIYFLVSRKKDIRLVPLSLCVLSFLSCWGPWGAFAVSLNSQRHRLEELLVKNGLMANGIVVERRAGAAPVKVRLKDRQAISSVTEYLVGNHGYRALQPLFKRNLDSIMRGDSLTERWQAFQQTQRILKLMNIGYANRWMDETEADSVGLADMPKRFYCYRNQGDVVSSTDGANFVANFTVDANISDSCELLEYTRGRLRICPDTARNQLHVSLASGAGEATADLAPIFRAVLSSNELTISLAVDQMTLPLKGGEVTGKVVLSDVRGMKAGSRLTVSRIQGIVLFSKR
ncbi:MAG TPA: DUF4153 domain-containing protein [Puia sp.]|nr:DUF4153 domain-containing protein [Puia sp.]